MPLHFHPIQRWSLTPHQSHWWFCCHQLRPSPADECCDFIDISIVSSYPPCWCFAHDVPVWYIQLPCWYRGYANLCLRWYAFSTCFKWFNQMWSHPLTLLRSRFLAWLGHCASKRFEERCQLILQGDIQTYSPIHYTIEAIYKVRVPS